MSPDVSGSGLLQGLRYSPALALLGRFMLASALWSGESEELQASLPAQFSQALQFLLTLHLQDPRDWVTVSATELSLVSGECL